MKWTFPSLLAAVMVMACAATPQPMGTTQPMTNVKSNGYSSTCSNCGTVSTIEPVEQKGTASGAGAVIGAVIGGVVGHQFGSGRGQDAATVGGAVAGGVAGHQAEKHRNAAVSYYQVKVNMDDRTVRYVNVPNTSGFAVGSRVRLIGNDMEIIG